MRSESMNRRTVLKGLVGGTAAGWLWPVVTSAQTKETFESLKQAVAVRGGGPAAGDEAFWSLVKRQFPIRDGLIMLNAANLTPTPQVVVDRQIGWLRDIDADASFANRAKFDPLKEEARRALAEYVGADPDEIAIVRNTSEGNNFVINGVALGKGDEVVIWDQNHPTANVAFDVRAERSGFRVIRVKTPESPDEPADLVRPFIEALTPRTKLIAFSQVSNVSGIRLPEKTLCSAARERGFLSLVDGAQTFGACPLDLSDMGCDFFTASSHKWFCGPKEVGLLYVRKDRCAALHPTIVGLGFEKAREAGARKFETLGQRDDARIGAMLEAVRFHNVIGRNRVSDRTLALADAVKRELRARIPSSRIVTPAGRDMSWGVVTFMAPGIDPAKAVTSLYREANIACAASGSGFRFSPHIYNTAAEIEAAVRAVAKIAG
jgi:selenocysteine lyase/cysteine desulfurase